MKTLTLIVVAVILMTLGGLGLWMLYLDVEIKMDHQFVFSTLLLLGLVVGVIGVREILLWEKTHRG